MTAKEMFEKKYLEWLKSVSAREWKNIEIYADAKKMSIPQYMMMCLEISVNEVNPRENAEVYWELVEMNKNKLVASNEFSANCRNPQRFWLTKKGYKELFC